MTPPAGAMPCEASPPPMPCWTCGRGLFWTCGGGSLEPPAPPLLGAGDGATGSLAGWVGAGLRFFVFGGGASEGSPDLHRRPGWGSSSQASSVAFLFSDLFVFPTLRSRPCSGYGTYGGLVAAALSDGWRRWPPPVPENCLTPATPRPTGGAPRSGTPAPAPAARSRIGPRPLAGPSCWLLPRRGPELEGREHDHGDRTLRPSVSQRPDFFVTTQRAIPGHPQRKEPVGAITARPAASAFPTHPRGRGRPSATPAAQALRPPAAQPPSSSPPRRSMIKAATSPIM